MIMKILKKEWFIWKFWKKGGGSREKGGGGNEIHAPCACGINDSKFVSIHDEEGGKLIRCYIKLRLPGNTWYCIKHQPKPQTWRK